MRIGRMKYIIALTGLLVFAGGCLESMSSEELRQARLVGNENLVLKKQLQKKEGEIADYIKQIEQYKIDHQNLKKEYNDFQKTYEKQVSEYKESLKLCQQLFNSDVISCPEIEKIYESIISELTSLLSDCQAKLDKYENTGQAEGNK